MDSVGESVLARKLGFAFGYFVFTTVMFFALSFAHKIPASWTYTHLMIVTGLVTLSGYLLKVFLK
ncbi:hypothetical protein HY640_05045 [Candidatus Woesearchaeota archaeon]|nr:hypothetical protein [Candidatus Woesearchaeota archaeon]